MLAEFSVSDLRTPGGVPRTASCRLNSPFASSSVGQCEGIPAMSPPPCAVRMHQVTGSAHVGGTVRRNAIIRVPHTLEMLE